MAFVTFGLFAFNRQGIEGALVVMLSHGLVSGALFLCVGVIYDRMHTREIARYGGLVYRMPAYAAVFMVFMLASVGLPGTSGFVGEFLVLMGAFQSNTWAGFFATTGLILGAPYMLYLYRRVIFGELVREELRSILDLNKRELATFAPLVALVLWMGIYPKPFLDVFAASVDNIVTRYQSARSAPPPAHPSEPGLRLLAKQ